MTVTRAVDFEKVGPNLWRCPCCHMECTPPRPVDAVRHDCPRAPRPTPTIVGPVPWQQWEEHHGQWVAIGELPPGYVTRPPGFLPFPGEVLATLAWPAVVT